MRLSLAAVALTVGTVAFAGVRQAHAAFGLNQDGTVLFGFNTTSPDTITFGRAITGLTASEHLVAIDFRNATGIYGLGNLGTFYRIDSVTAAATIVGTPGGAGPLNGVNFDMEIVIQGNAARVVSDTGTNFRIDIATGTRIANDPNLSYAPGDPHAGQTPNIMGMAISAAGTYAIDSRFDTLVQLNESTGLLTTIGPLGVDVGAVGGLDTSFLIRPDLGTYAVLQPVGSSVSNLYGVNLTTGAATFGGQIGGGFIVSDFISNAVIPEPASLGLLALAAPALLVRRRKA